MSTNNAALPTRSTHHPAGIIAKLTRTSTLAAGVCLLTMLLAGCGSTSSKTTTTTVPASSTSTSTASTSTTAAAPTPSSPLPAGVIAEVANTTITEPVLAQWMAETVASDYYSIATHIVAPHLVSEPANYPACVTTLKKLTPIPGEGPPQHQPTPTQLLTRCKELYETVKQQALSEPGRF